MYEFTPLHCTLNDSSRIDICNIFHVALWYLPHPHFPLSLPITLTRRRIDFSFPLFSFYCLLSVRPSSKWNKLRFHEFCASSEYHSRERLFSHFTHSLANHFEQVNGFDSTLFSCITSKIGATIHIVGLEKANEGWEERSEYATQQININGIISMLSLCHIKFSYNISSAWIHFITSTSSLHSFRVGILATEKRIWRQVRYARVYMNEKNNHIILYFFSFRRRNRMPNLIFAQIVCSAARAWL